MKLRTVKVFGIALFLVVSAFAAKKVFNHVIDQALCDQCGDCVKICPVKGAITVTKTKDGKIMHEIDPAVCTQCGICVDKCPLEAIKVVEVKPVKK